MNRKKTKKKLLIISFALIVILIAKVLLHINSAKTEAELTAMEDYLELKYGYDFEWERHKYLFSCEYDVSADTNETYSVYPIGGFFWTFAFQQGHYTRFPEDLIEQYESYCSIISKELESQLVVDILNKYSDEDSDICNTVAGRKIYELKTSIKPEGNITLEELEKSGGIHELEWYN